MARDRHGRAGLFPVCQRPPQSCDPPAPRPRWSPNPPPPRVSSALALRCHWQLGPRRPPPADATPAP
eukprot:5494615-Lingulodinium_polyedra.AAC.1